MSIVYRRNRRGKIVRRVRNSRQCVPCFESHMPLVQSRVYCAECQRLGALVPEAGPGSGRGPGAQAERRRAAVSPGDALGDPGAI